MAPKASLAGPSWERSDRPACRDGLPIGVIPLGMMLFASFPASPANPIMALDGGRGLRKRNGPPRPRKTTVPKSEKSMSEET